MRPKWRGITHGAPNGPVCGRRFCAGDGRWRPVADFATLPRGSHDSYCQACRRIQAHERVLRQTPAQRERRRETERFYRDRKRREAGTLATYTPRGPSKIDRAERVLLPAGPLVAELERRIGRVNGQDPLSWEDLARRAGVPARSLFRLRHGVNVRVRIDLADKLAVTIGVPLAFIYPGEP